MRDQTTVRTTPVSLEIVPGAPHLFEEPATLEEVSRLALVWCRRDSRSSRS
jgi:putative phosphoribosyl transferase